MGERGCIAKQRSATRRAASGERCAAMQQCRWEHGKPVNASELGQRATNGVLSLSGASGAGREEAVNC